MTHHGGTAKTFSRKAVCIIIRMKIVYGNGIAVGKFVCSCKSYTAFEILILCIANVEFVVGFGFKTCDVVLTSLCVSCKSEGSFFVFKLLYIDLVLFVTVRQPFKMYAVSVRYNTEDIDVACVEKKGLVGSIAPTVMLFHFALLELFDVWCFIFKL